MLLQARTLAEYYTSPQGALVRQAIAPHIRSLLSRSDFSAGVDRKGACLGYGFTQPYLEAISDCVGPIKTFIPYSDPTADAEGRPDIRSFNACEEGLLPFGDADFDTVILIHGLEGAESARTLLRQVWRVLAPEGRLIVVVPNRVSLWAVSEVSPFACGRPYRRAELSALLRDTLFEPVSVRRALYVPPRKMSKTVFYPALWDAVGRRFFSSLCGVYIAAAKKSLYCVTPLPDLQKSKVRLAAAGNL